MRKKILRNTCILPNLLFMVRKRKRCAGPDATHASPLIQEVETGGSLAQGLFQTQNEFKASLTHLETPHLNIKFLKCLET